MAHLVNNNVVASTGVNRRGFGTSGGDWPMATGSEDWGVLCLVAFLLGSAGIRCTGIKIQSVPGFSFLEQGVLEWCHSLAIRFLQLTFSQSSVNNSLAPREFQNSFLLVHDRPHAFQLEALCLLNLQCHLINRKLFRLAHTWSMHDLFICGVSTFGEHLLSRGQGWRKVWGNFPGAILRLLLGEHLVDLIS